MSKITAISGRVLYNSRGSKTIEVDIITDEKFLGRVCAPSGASVGKFEAVSFPSNSPEESLSILNKNSDKFIGIDSSDLKQIHDIIRTIDETDNYAKIGGACISYLEWVQNNMGYYWSFDEVASKMEKNITQGFKDAYALSKKHKVDMRKATMVLAVERVLEAFNQKGIWP